MGVLWISKQWFTIFTNVKLLIVEADCYSRGKIVIKIDEDSLNWSIWLIWLNWLKQNLMFLWIASHIHRC